MAIRDIQTAFHRIPLVETLSDATHGDMSFFHLVTLRLRDNDGVEGGGYTYADGTALDGSPPPAVPSRQTLAVDP